MQLFRAIRVYKSTMEMVMDGLLALGLIFAGLWIWSLRGSVSRDQSEARKRDTEAEAAAAQAVREAKLQRKGERLRCLSCGKAFRGPLPQNGCPRCHLASFVVPQSDVPNPANPEQAKED